MRPPLTYLPLLAQAHLGIDEQLYCGTQDGFLFQGNEGDFVKVDVSDPGGDYTIVGRAALRNTSSRGCHFREDHRPLLRAAPPHGDRIEPGG